MEPLFLIQMEQVQCPESTISLEFFLSLFLTLLPYKYIHRHHLKVTSLFKKMQHTGGRHYVVMHEGKLYVKEACQNYFFLLFCKAADFFLKLSHLRFTWVYSRETKVFLLFFILSGHAQFHCHDTKPPFTLLRECTTVSHLRPGWLGTAFQHYFYAFEPWCSLWGIETWLQHWEDIFPLLSQGCNHQNPQVLLCVSSICGFPLQFIIYIIEACP